MSLNRLRSRSGEFRIKYIEYRERYDGGHNGSHIENHLWPFDWHLEGLDDVKPPYSSKSLKLHAEYFENDVQV